MLWLKYTKYLHLWSTIVIQWGACCEWFCDKLRQFNVRKILTHTHSHTTRQRTNCMKTWIMFLPCARFIIFYCCSCFAFVFGVISPASSTMLLLLFTLIVDCGFANFEPSSHALMPISSSKSSKFTFDEQDSFYFLIDVKFTLKHRHNSDCSLSLSISFVLKVIKHCVHSIPKHLIK